MDESTLTLHKPDDSCTIERSDNINHASDILHPYQQEQTTPHHTDDTELVKSEFIIVEDDGQHQQQETFVVDATDVIVSTSTVESTVTMIDMASQPSPTMVRLGPVITTDNKPLVAPIPSDHSSFRQDGVDVAIKTDTDQKQPSSSWKWLLAESRAYENCTIHCQNGSFRTHKILLCHNNFIKYMLSNDDSGDESAIYLPDFTIDEVEGALHLFVPPTGQPVLDGALQSTSQSDLVSMLEEFYLKHRAEHKQQTELVETKNDQSASTGLKVRLIEVDKILKKPEDKQDQSQKTLKRKKTVGKKQKRPTLVQREFQDFIDDHDEENEENEEDVDDLHEDNDDSRPAKKAKASGKSQHPFRRKRGVKAENRNCVCVFCGKGFAIQKYLDSHITNKHPDKSEINSYIEELTRTGEFMCLLCEKTFSIARRCRYHLKFKHKIGAKFSCDQCSKMFYYEYDLELHRRFHSAKRNFVCDLCGKGFLMENVLQNHKHNMHSTKEEKEKARKFVCSFCAKGFFSKSALQEHEFLHSEKKNFHCDMCGLSFKQSSGLRAHNNRHHSAVGPKPITEQHKEKMRAYMKRYRAIKAGKLPDNINHTFRSTKKETDPLMDDNTETKTRIAASSLVRIANSHPAPVSSTSVVTTSCSTTTPANFVIGPDVITYQHPPQHHQQQQQEQLAVVTSGHIHRGEYAVGGGGTVQGRVVGMDKVATNRIYYI